MTLTFDVGKQPVTLTEEEARDLYGQLGRLFGQRLTQEQQDIDDCFGWAPWPPVPHGPKWTCHV